MCYFIWLIVGIILLTITTLVHRNTYTCDDWGDVCDKLPTHRWLCIVCVVITIIPIVNAIAFSIGLMMYCVGLMGGGITFCCEYKWWKSLTEWLTEEV
jgi:hypothetical protein